MGRKPVKKVICLLCGKLIRGMSIEDCCYNLDVHFRIKHTKEERVQWAKVLDKIFEKGK